MADYQLQLTFDWSELPSDRTLVGPLHQALFSGGDLISEPKDHRHDFQPNDTASLIVCRGGTGEIGVPYQVTFIFDHAAGSTAASDDNPFSGKKGSAVTWPLVRVTGETHQWRVAKGHPKVTLKSKTTNSGESWHFGIYLVVQGEYADGTAATRGFCCDPELVVGPWN